MSVYYAVFAEMKIKDKWYGLNPNVKNFITGECKPVPILEGNSYFREAYYKFRDNESSAVGMPKDISEEVKSIIFRGYEEDMYSDIEEIKKSIGMNICVANYADAFKRVLKKDREFIFHGYVDKHAIAGFEADIDDIEEWLTEEEYNELDDEEKMQYAYYEWNDDGLWSWYGIYKKIEHSIDCLIAWFADNHYCFNYKNEEFSYQDLYITADKVRVIFYMD